MTLVNETPNFNEITFEANKNRTTTTNESIAELMDFMTPVDFSLLLHFTNRKYPSYS